MPLALLLLTACGGAAPHLDLPDAALADVSCAPREALSGTMIRLARRLDQAGLRIVPLRLRAEQARWILQEGWDFPPREVAGAEGAVRARAAEATLLVPGLPCARIADRLPPMLMRVSMRPEEGVAPPSSLFVEAVSGEETVAGARLDAAAPEALLEAEPGSTPFGAALTLRSDPPGSLALEAIAVPLGRASIRIDREYRDAIVASSVREASFDLRVPEGASLRFATAATRRPFGEAVELPPEADGDWSFRITIAPTGGDPVELFRERVPSEHAREDRWREHVVDLAAWGGRQVSLTLAVDPSGEPPEFALWGNPVVAAVAPATVDAPRRPNLLLISIDALRADRVGRVARGIDLTPNLNRLGREGVVFTHCRTQAPSTLYGHASLLTGLPPSGHGATTTSALPDGVPYLPDLLAGAGWTTVAITDDGLLDGRFGFTRGFDRFRDRFEPVEEKVAAATDWLRDMPQPWFLFFHTMAAHSPYPAPEATAARLTGGYDGPLAGASDGVSALTLMRINNGVVPVEPSDVRYLEGLYDVQVARVDSALGRLFDALRGGGRWEDTVIVVTADHGEEFDEHGVVAWHSLTCYDEVQRVPLIIKPSAGTSPGARGPGRVGSDVRSMDIAPSLLDLAGLTPPEPMMGRSLAQEMQEGGGPDRETLCEIEDGRGAALLLDGWKYHMRTADSAADPRTFRRRLATRGRYRVEELYDLARDPGERDDRAADDSDRTRALRQALLGRLEEARALRARLGLGAPPPARPRVDDEHTERLRSLGYVH